MGGSLEWVWLVAGIAIGAVAAMLLGWALFSDRARGRRRCPKCWYDMVGVPGLTCPECGRAVKAERGLGRTRRRWRWAVVGAVLLGAGVGIAGAPRYTDRGWPGLVPSSVLVWTAPLDAPGAGLALINGWPTGLPAVSGRGTIEDRLCDEVWFRCESDLLAAWQERVLLDRVIRSMKPSFAPMIVVPPRWPVGVPLPTLINGAAAAIPCPTGIVNIRVRCGSPGTPWIGLRGWAQTITIPGPPQSTDRLVFEFVARVGRESSPIKVEVPVKIGGDVGSFLAPIDTPEFTEMVRGIVAPRLGILRDGSTALVFGDHAPDAHATINDHVAFSYRIVLGDRTLGTGRGAAPWALRKAEPWAIGEVDWVMGGLAEATAAQGRTEIVVTGDPEGAGRLFIESPFDGWNATCWAGEFRMPLVLASEQPP